MSHTTTLTPAMINSIALVGTTVTFNDRQYTVYSIEGDNWYAHRASDGTTLLDTALTSAAWITEPIATLVPSGYKIGMGFAETVGIAKIKRGVCLAKAY